MSKQVRFQWTAPWDWSKRTRYLKIGKLIDCYIHLSADGYYVTINGKQLGRTTRKLPATFKTMREVKQAAEIEITKMIKSAYKQIAE